MALPHALRMAQATGWSLCLVRVIPAPSYYHGLPGPYAAPMPARLLPGETRETAQSYLAHTAARLPSQELMVTCVVLEGDPAAALLAHVQEDATLAMVVMATHGRSGVQHLLFGSVAEKLLHVTPVPLLLVRRSDALAPAALTSYQTMLIPLDGSPHAEQALRLAQHLARPTTSMVLMHAIPTPHDVTVARQGTGGTWDAIQRADAHASADAYLRTQALPTDQEGDIVRTMVREGHAGEQIVSAALEANADLIVMATHGRTGVQRLWLGSMATYVLRHSQLPVLLVRADEQQRPNRLTAPAQQRAQDDTTSIPHPAAAG